MTSELSEWRAMNLKPDLLGAAPVYLDLQQRWNTYPALVAESSLKRILHRYENMWLPLLVEWQGVDLEPPTDVHWIWHVHMLHPREYIDYCTTRFGRMLRHKIRLSDSEEKFALDRARLIWQDKYKHENFNLDLDNVHMGTYQIQGSKLSWILSAALRVRRFVHQVSLPHYRDSNFLFEALNRYKKFLVLKKYRPGARVVVPVDILLMWKLHALFPLDYYNEAYRPLKLYSLITDTDHDGRWLVHGGYCDTEWGALYQEPLLVPGSAYRGDPKFTTISMLPPDPKWEPIIDQCDITIDEISVSELWSRDKSLVIVMRLLGDTSFAFKEILRIETPVNKVNRAAVRTQGLVSFRFHIKENRSVEIDVYAVRGRCGCGQTEIHLSTIDFNPREPFGNSAFFTRDFLYQVPKVSCVDPKVSFRCRLVASPPVPHVFSMNRGPFTPVRQLPPDLLPFVQTLPKWRDAIAGAMLEGDSDTEFKCAGHGLQHRDGIVDFRVDVIKQHDLDLGAILVRHNEDHLVALAHSIGDETLASSSQLTTRCPLSLDPEADELAMSISNHQGEWAVCKGSWYSKNGDGGVKLSVFILDDLMDLTFDIRDDQLQTIKFADVTIDMPTGRVTIDSLSSTIAENIALAFCVGILYVTCQMRATLLATSKRNSTINLIGNGSVHSTKSASDIGSDLAGAMDSPKTTSRFTARRRNRKMNRRRKMSASYTFLLATGLLSDLKLQGSLRATQTPSRTSLANIHLLYHNPVDGSPDKGLLDSRNNNYNTASLVPNGYGGRQSEIASAHVTNDVRAPTAYTNGSTHVTSFGGNDEDAYYMDVRL